MKFSCKNRRMKAALSKTKWYILKTTHCEGMWVLQVANSDDRMKMTARSDVFYWENTLLYIYPRHGWWNIQDINREHKVKMMKDLGHRERERAQREDETTKKMSLGDDVTDDERRWCNEVEQEDYAMTSWGNYGHPVTRRTLPFIVEDVEITKHR